jgi:hypothetical protein
MSRRQSEGLLDEALRDAAHGFQFESLGVYRAEPGELIGTAKTPETLPNSYHRGQSYNFR